MYNCMSITSQACVMSSHRWWGSGSHAYIYGAGAQQGTGGTQQEHNGTLQNNSFATLPTCSNMVQSPS